MTNFEIVISIFAGIFLVTDFFWQINVDRFRRKVTYHLKYGSRFED